MFYIPPTLVLGCNNPVSFNPLKDWIEEVTEIEPDFQQSGYSDGLISRFGYGCGHSYGGGGGGGNGYGDGDGNGGGYPDSGYGYGYSRGGGDGFGHGYGHSRDGY